MNKPKLGGPLERVPNPELLPPALIEHIRNLEHELPEERIKAARGIASDPHPNTLGALNWALDREENERVRQALWKVWKRVLTKTSEY